MLTEILANYSEGELAMTIGASYIKNYEALSGNTLNKTELVKATQMLAGFQLVRQKSERERLIARMPVTIVAQALSLLLEKINGLKPFSDNSNALKTRVDNCDKYYALKDLSERYLQEFGSLFGFEEDLSLIEKSATSVRGMKPCNPAYPLYPYQQKIVNKINQIINKKNDNRCLIHLPTGAGKTRTAMNIVCEHLRENEKGLVLWLANTAELCTQAADEFYKAWSSLGNRKLKAYCYFSDTPITLGGIDQGFLVAGLQKLNSVKKSGGSTVYQKLREHVSLIIFDEAHKAIASTYEAAIQDMLVAENKPHAFLLGLTATPGRKLNAGQGADNEDRALAEFFSTNKVTMKVTGYESPIKYLQEQGCLAKAKFHTIKYTGGKIVHANQFTSKTYKHEIYDLLSKNENRNLQLINTIKYEHDRGNSIIVFASNVEHSRNLAVFLAFKGVKAYSLDSQQDTAETRRFKISEYSNGKVKVLINYNILTAGFDAPITSVAIIARPTDSLVQYSQMVGRAMRGKASGGNATCDIYTVRDDIPAFTSVVEQFTHWDELWEEV